MSDRIDIRPAREDDIEFIAGLVPSLLEFGSPAWEQKEAFVSGFGEALARAVRDQDLRSSVLLAEGTDGTPLGFISLKVTRDVAGVERGHVADLAVAQSARRRGVGQRLMQAGEAWARERGFAALSLDVWATNEAALEFYRGLGYATESACLIKKLDRR
jgi:ribosomal protein S18 acetylase RimI-like enzyme